MNDGAEKKSVDYNKVSRVYDTSRIANAETTEKLTRLLRISNNSIVLDMGCGTGNYTFALGRVAKSIVGIDLSIGMLEQAHGKRANLSLTCGDITNLPLSSEAFDGAFAIQVLHHIREKELFLTEAYRVLRRGASIAIQVCSHKQLRTFWFYHFFPKGLDLDLGRMPDSQEIAALLEKAGFSGVGLEICFTDVVVADETPKQYLDKRYRDSISTFAFLSDEEIESGCRRIREDIMTGKAKDIVQKSEYEVANRIGGTSLIYGQKK
ncbi:MAG: methyltransferase domain-containing protein [Deltaproteobacteria bacterium]|nr:methyltransferase domain-containing protein [Deltaproteobacteria bacterium]